MKPKSILLLEEDYLKVIDIQKTLGKLNVEYTLHVAHTEAEALYLLEGVNPGTQSIEPDIVILDININNINAPEYLEIVKKNSRSGHIKVFFIMKANSKSPGKTGPEKHSATGYILRPLDFQNNDIDKNQRTIAELRDECHES